MEPPPEPIAIKAVLFASGRTELREDQVARLQLSDSQTAFIEAVGATLRAYADAIDGLLRGKYAAIHSSIPSHLSNLKNVFGMICEDGVVLRFQKEAEHAGVMVGFAPVSLRELVPVVSQQLVHCHSEKPSLDPSSPGCGISFTLRKHTAVTGTVEDLATVIVAFHAVLERTQAVTQPPHKPQCLLSVRNSFEIELQGVLMPTDPALPQSRDFVARAPMRLPVDWECLEVYPYSEASQWRPEYASLWAENDILAGVVADKFREAHFQTLDPLAAGRRQMEHLLKQYLDLLNSNPEREETLQVFLKDHPILLSPSHVRVWPKLSLGAYKTDFVFQEAAGDYLLVELERSVLLFIGDGHISSEMSHAIGQVTDWIRYLEDNLATVQRELGLMGISSNPRSLVVIGRSSGLTPDNRRKLSTMANMQPNLRVVTYDDIYSNTKALVENLFGPIWEGEGTTQIYYPR